MQQAPQASTLGANLDFASAAWELLSTMSMELIMFAVAGLCYALLYGGLLKPLVPGKKVAEDGVRQEAEEVAKELQNKLNSGDHLAAYKLWQRAKSFEHALSGEVLTAATKAMRSLGRSASEVAAEFTTALECNPALADGEAATELLDALRKEGKPADELREQLAAIFSKAEAQRSAAQSRPKAKQAQVASLSAALKRGSVDDIIEQLKRLKGSLPPRDQLEQALNLAGRKHRLMDIGELLAATGGTEAVDTAMVNALLGESARRRDAALCRQTHQLVQKFGIAKEARTFEILARGLAADTTAVGALFTEAEQADGVSITTPLGLAFLAACGVCRDSDLAGRVFEAHRRDAGGSPDPSVCAALLKAYSECGQHERVCSVYEQEMSPWKATLDKQLGGLLVKSATQAGRGDLAQALCASPAADEANRHLAMIRACGRERNLDGATEAFRRLQEGGAAPDTKAHNALLDACAQCRNDVQALELFSAMKRDGVADTVSFNIVLKLLLSCDRQEEAREVLREMPAHGVQANVVTYNEMCNAKVGKGDMRGAWAVVGEMKAAGLRPNSVTCSILFKSITRSSAAADADQIMSLLDNIEDRMDEVLFSSVVEACIRVGRLDAVAAQMRKFATQGGLVALTPQTYGSLFKAYGQARDVERLWELWTEMERRQVAPTPVTVGCFVDALVMNGGAEEALGVVHRLLKDPERSGLVNNVIFSTLLKGFAMTKQVERLFAVYAEMRERGITVNTVTFNTLLDACARSGCMDRAPGLMAEMRAAGVSPDRITYSALAKGHCFSGDVDAAFAVLAEMRTEGFKPDEVFYNSLLDGCAKEHRLQEALDLFAVTRAEGVKPSNFTLCTLVKLLGRARRLPQAFGILEELCMHGGLRPNIQVYTCLMTACADNGQLERALQLHEEVVAAGCPPDQKMYNMLVRTCLRSGSLDKAVEVARCAPRLPAQGFTLPRHAYGVDAKVLEELVVRLNQGGRADVEVAHSLVTDLKRCGVHFQENVYAQVVQRATRGAGPR